MKIVARIRVIRKVQWRHSARTADDVEIQNYQSSRTAQRHSLKRGDDKVSRIGSIRRDRHRAAQGSHLRESGRRRHYHRRIIVYVQVIRNDEPSRRIANRDRYCNSPRRRHYRRQRHRDARTQSRIGRTDRQSAVGRRDKRVLSVGGYRRCEYFAPGSGTTNGSKIGQRDYGAAKKYQSDNQTLAVQRQHNYILLEMT